MTTGTPLVRFVQPTLRRYRVPVFEGLAALSDWRMELWADLHPTGPSASGTLDGMDALPCVHAPCREIGPFLWQPGLRRAAGGEVSIVVLTWNSRHLWLLPALRRARRRGVGGVLWGHGFGKSETATRRRIRNALLHHADAAVLYGEPARRQLIAEGFDAERLFVAPNAVDQTPVRRAKAAWDADRLAAFQRREGLDGREVVVFLSRLEPSKRVDRLVEAFSSLHARRPRATLVVIGEGADGPLVAAAASRLPQGSVRLLGGIFAEDELAPWMLSARLFAYPRAIGLSIFHAFGFGLPVVTCTKPGGHGPEIDALEDGVNGLLYPDGDTDALAERMERVLADDALRARLAAAAQATVDGEGGWDVPAMTDAFRRCFEFVASVRRSGRRSS
ncbi:MAG: glycosyltransferase family 4 protein [Planctomycetota bacterium]|jgi:glycosyltransferase involved in cell wall biosynthesis